MSAPDREDGERVTRRQAAERLTDLAYALTVGGPIEMGDGEVTGRIPEELVMKRGTTAQDARVGLQLELSWPSREEPDDRRPRRP
jgi:hypothetical protein